MDEPEEESPPPEEVQHKLMEVTKTLQSLQNVVKRFPHPSPKVRYDVLSTKNKRQCGGTHRAGRLVQTTAHMFYHCHS